MNKQIKAGADIHAGDGGYSEGTQEQYDAFVKVRNKSLAQGRIRQLAEQAGFIDRGSNHTAYMSFDHEKFAELIVRECGLWFNDRLVVNPDYGIEHRVERNRAVIGVMKEFNQHFGVEE